MRKREKRMFAETRLAFLVSPRSYRALFLFFLEQPDTSLNSFFDRPCQEDSLLALTLLRYALILQFATGIASIFFSSIVHFREPYLWFLVPGFRPGLKRV